MPRRSRRLLGLKPLSQPLPVNKTNDDYKPTSKLERKSVEQLGLTNAKSTNEPDDSKYPKARPFPLLNLPIELRYMIYELMFVNHLVVEGYEKEGCCINKKEYVRPSGSWCPPSGAYDRTASLLRTCKALHGEATNFLYSTDVFVIERPLGYSYGYRGKMGRLLDWLQKIGPKNRSHLRSITFKDSRDLGFLGPLYSGGDANYRACTLSVAKLLANSANLQKLTTLHVYNTHFITNTWACPPSEESKSKNWTYRACMTAEIMYKDFRPMISQAIESGRPLDDILNLLMPDEKSFEWYDRGSRFSRAVKGRWTQEQADEGKAAVTEHMMLLLERNLAYQRKRGWVRN